MSISTIIGLFGALQGVVLASAVASMAGATRRPNRALALVLFVFSLSVVTIVAEHAGLFGSSMWLVLLEYVFTFLFPPALWYYTDTVLGVKSRVPIGVHLVPAALWIAYLIAFSLGWFGPGASAWRWLPPIAGVIAYLSLYTVAVAVRIWRRSVRSHPLILHQVVLRALVVALFAMHAAQLVRFFFQDVAALKDIVPITGTGIVYALSVLAFRQSRIFAGHEPGAHHKKYQASTLTKENSEQIQARLLLIMERDKPYMNENLNFAELASRLSIPKAHLSQVINEELGTNFSGFVNDYRVREATRLLGDPAAAHLSIEGVGYEVGFRSRSGFYSAFKRVAGETPAQTRDRLS